MKPIVLDITRNNFKIFLHHKKAVKDNYMLFKLAHFVKPFINAEIKECQNQDLWRLLCLYEYKMDNDGNLKPCHDYPIANHGEWECAIRICDTYDFHGGFHGSERLTEFTAYADGIEITDNKDQVIEADKVTFYQKSNIYLQLTENEIIAEHEKWYEFSENGLSLKQRVLWKIEAVIHHAYLTMFPIMRRSGEDDTGDQITEKVRIEGIDKTFDVTNLGHELHHSDFSKTLTDIKGAEIWGDASGIYGKVTLNEGNLPTNRFFVQDEIPYNKFYFSVAGNGGNYTTRIGEEWKTDTHFDVYRFIEY